MPIPTNTCTYEYIQIHAIRTNTYQYMQYVPLPIRTSIRAKLIHTNTYQNTCQNTYPYIPIHVHWFNTCQYDHCTSLMSHGLVGRPSWHSEPLGALVHRSERAEARIIISLGLSSQRQGLYRWCPGTSWPKLSGRVSLEPRRSRAW